MQPFGHIRVYGRSFEFGLSIHRFCKLLPKEETYGISAQLRRAALSISTNIAEGSKAASSLDYANYLNIAQKSTAESQSLLRFCQSAGYAPGADYRTMLSEAAGIAMMLHALRAKVLADAEQKGERKRRPKRKSSGGSPL